MGDAPPPILVRVLPPYDAEFPGVYELGQSPVDAGLTAVVDAPPLKAPDPPITVRVLPPFHEAFPGEHLVEDISESGVWKIAGGCDFDPSYLEVVLK
jgi:hypothetical protein